MCPLVGQRPDPDLGILHHRAPPVGGPVVARVSCRAKALCFGTDGGDTRWCHTLLEDVIVVLLTV